MGIQKLTTPLGDAVVARIDVRDVTVTGTIAGQGGSTWVVDDGSRTRYRLEDTGRAGRYAGQRVRISGVLHRSTGILDVRCIAPLAQLPHSALDRHSRAL